MKIFLIAVSLLIVTNPVFADRVCIRKSDGFPIEYQSGDAPLGTLTKNATQSGYDESEIEEKYISAQDYKELHFEKITKPLIDKKKAEDAITRDKAIQKLKKTGLTQKEAEDLIEELKKL